MRGGRTAWRAWLLATLGLGAFRLGAAPAHDAGCLFSAGENLHGRPYARALGPVFEETRQGEGEAAASWAVRPFLTYEAEARTGRRAWDVLWPLASHREWKGAADGRFLTAFWHDPDTSDPASAYRFWFLPFLALGRNPRGEDYGALFPLGGRVDQWFGRDRVEFALFPLYWHSELNDLRTDHWLWPLVSRTTGDRVHRFRVFPFYGTAERRGEGSSRFVLWPFWTSLRRDRPGHEEQGFMLFPLYGHAKSASLETWMFLPPFFRHSVGASGTNTVILWPFCQTASGEEDKFYLWPLYGRRTMPEMERRFWVWPFVWHHQGTRGGAEERRFRVFPVFVTESREETGARQGRSSRYTSVWPLASYRRDADGNRRFRALDLWPFKDTRPVERNLAPWWSVVTHERTAAGYETELLWGVARWGRDRDGARHGSVFPLFSWTRDPARNKLEWSFLKGMISRYRAGDRRACRVLYFMEWRNEP
jgi:hypothetical protein